MTIPVDVQAALTRLAAYNGLSRDAATNPYGFGANGHEANFTLALNDLALVANWLVTVPDDAGASAALAAAWAATAADTDVPGAAAGSRSALHQAIQAAASAVQAAAGALAAAGSATAASQSEAAAADYAGQAASAAAAGLRWAGTVGGTADAIVLSAIAPAITVHAPPLTVAWIAAMANVGAGTLDIGYGPRSLLDADGSALEGGDVRVGLNVAAYDGSGYRLVSPGSAYDLVAAAVGTVPGGTVQAVLQGLYDAMVKLAGGNTVAGAQRTTVVTVPYAATITLDVAAGNVFDLTLTGNATLANPASLLAGVEQCVTLRVRQGGAGGYTLAWGAYWDFEGGVVPSLSSAAGAVDVLIGETLSATSVGVKVAMKGVA